MSKTVSFIRTSVGRKIVVALSGLFLISFLVVHLTINLFALKVKSDGGAEFDFYAHFMATYPLIRPVEWILFGGFLLHAALGLYLFVLNRKARPIQYEVNKRDDNSTWTSRFAWLTGALVGVFLIVHVNTFFVQSRSFFGNPPLDDRRMIELLKDAFASPLYVTFYIVALLFLAYHLRHGFQSAMQTLGWRVGKYERLVDAIGVVVWLLLPIGFAIIPLYFLFALN